MNARLNEFKRMVSSGGPEAEAYLKKITAEAKAEGKFDQMNEVVGFLLESASGKLDKLEDSMRAYTLHQRMGNLTDAINLAYIARQYFGKSRQWLYQRVKCQMVNGKPAAFTASEEATFLRALNDIGMQLTAFASQTE